MSRRRVKLVVLVTALLCACSSGASTSKTSSTASGQSNSSGPSRTETTSAADQSYCLTLASTRAKVTSALSAAKPADQKALIAAVITDLKAAQADAPPQIARSLTDLIATMRVAGDFLADPAHATEARHKEIGDRLVADGKVMDDYLSQTCGIK